jgi:precorrin-4/cobalt-precorrin-4 C11-methyltransferase
MTSTTVHFIGAGPGAPDLITVRGLALIRRCPVCLYAGSLVPSEVVAEAPAGARVVDTASLHLDQIVAEIEAARAAGHEVARVHSGDPSLYGAIAEQIRRLDALGIPWTITPGVPAFAAAAAALGSELTLPDVAQSIVLTRTTVRASAMPEGETLAAFARTGATLCLHLSITNLGPIVRELVPILGADMPVAVVYRASWPDQRIIRGTLATIRAEVKAAGITRTALILVGRVLGEPGFSDSRLYAADHSHVLRPSTLDSHVSASGIEPAAPSGG